MEASNLEETSFCQRMNCALSRVGDKWSVQTAMQLETGPKRFSELRRGIGGISHKMLAATLRALERDGFVARTVYPTKPPSVEYALTEFGHEMVVPIKALSAWVLDNLGRIERARRDYDTEAG